MLGRKIKDLDENTHRIEEYKGKLQRSITIKKCQRTLRKSVYLGQLSKIFGMRFSDYVHQLRIDEAKRLLEETTMEMSEIAREWDIQAKCLLNILKKYRNLLTIKTNLNLQLLDDNQ